MKCQLGEDSVLTQNSIERSPHGLKSTFKSIISVHGSSLHPQIQVETLPCKQGPVHKPDAETRSLGLR